MRTKVNRSERTKYNKVRQKEMTDLDLAAAAILAVNYSGRSSQTNATQKLIQMDCVAVCLINESYWIASNTQRITGDNLDQFANFLEKEKITCYLVKNGKGNMHAEMQLLSELLQEDPSKKNVKNSLFEYSFGVSKPCCSYCADQLNFYGIAYTHYHDDPVKNWEAPC